ncbi:hypothetical protein [Nonomuraea longicatena]
MVELTHQGGPESSAVAVIAALELLMSARWLPDFQDQAKLDNGNDLWMPCGHGKAAEYLYRDRDDTVLYGVDRCPLRGSGCQGFRQWRPDPSKRSGRRWSLYGDDGRLAVRLVPYHLPEVLAAVREERVVMICKDEKDVEALRARPYITATCNPMGAGEWRPEFAEYLYGADVSVVADRDETGRKHAAEIVGQLMQVARSIYVVQATHGKDAADHLTAGGTTGDLVPVWEPKPYPNGEHHG